MTTKTIHESSPVGTHPSLAASGVGEVTCDECGATAQFTAVLYSRYRYNSDNTGMQRTLDGDLCDECYAQIYACDHPRVRDGYCADCDESCSCPDGEPGEVDMSACPLHGNA